MSQLLHLTRLVTSVSYLTHHSPCRIIFPLYLNLALCLFVIVVESEVPSILLQLKLLLHLSFIPRLTIATLSFSTFLASQLDRLQLVLNSAARAVSRTPHFTHISPVLESLHWLKIDQRNSLQNSLNHLQNTPISQPPLICTIFSVSNLTRALVLLPLSLSNARQFALDLK